MGGWGDPYYPEEFCADLLKQFTVLKGLAIARRITMRDVQSFVNLVAKYVDAAEDDLPQFMPKICKDLGLNLCRFVVPCRGASDYANNLDGGELRNETDDVVIRITEVGAYYDGGILPGEYHKDFRYRTRDQMITFFRVLARQIDAGMLEGWPW